MQINPYLCLMTFYKKFEIVLIIVALILTGCAKEMAPTGGPKDTYAPEVKKANPKPNSLHFDSKKISITFNEFLSLKDASQKVTISPPLNKKPEVRLKGKTVIVELNDTLRQNTTYNINFRDAIRDYTEGNIKDNFQYVFSTGGEIDTIFISGVVKNAATGLPVENVQVGLYNNIYDSVVAKEKPLYYSITNKAGEFTINNIKKGEYKIFALSDIANDMLYKLPNEKVAFLDETLKPETYKDIAYDTLKIIKEISAESGDTIFADTIIQKSIVASTIEKIRLNLFEPDYQKQFVKTSSRPRRNLINIVLNREPYSETTLRTFDDTNFVQVCSQRPDSLLFVIPSFEMTLSDTLKAVLEYGFLDSLENLTIQKDTITLAVEKNKVFDNDTIVTFTSNIVGNVLDKNKKLVLNFNHPVNSIDFEKIKLFTVEDTVKKAIDFNTTLDTTKSLLTIDYQFVQSNSYEMIFDSLAISDIYEQYSHPKSLKFRVPDESEYGVLAVNIVGEIENNSVIELYDNSKNIVWQSFYPTTQTLTINDLKPGKYTLRLFIDSNGNKKWDTGDYYKKLLPELVLTYSKDITIRANWDTEITWNLK
ncbi:MAG TPA: Ig-like domain-containing protein [Salinivirgaceae bacterium]|nr:Ig-like domain-containing protein [Salinivirgaceae bacterium]